MTKRLFTYRQRKRIIVGLTVLLMIFLSIAAGLFFSLLTGCTRTTVLVEPLPLSEGYITIRPKQDDHVLPAVQYHFYNYNEAVPYRVFDSDAQGNFKGVLPAGHYRVLATNTSASGVVFRGMDDHRTAIVYDTTLRGTSRGGRSCSGSTTATRVIGAEPVYSLIMTDLEVLPEDTAHHTPLPVRLTRTMSVAFTLTGELANQVTGIKGSMQGIYPSIFLFTGSTPYEDVVRSLGIWMDFTTTTHPEDSHLWQAEFHLFGLCDPRNGEAYRNILQLSLEMADGDYPFEIDLTNHLSDVLVQTGGVLPLELPLEVKLEWKELEVISNITPWKRDGDTEIPIPVG